MTTGRSSSAARPPERPFGVEVMGTYIEVKGKRIKLKGNEERRVKS
jgi:hypothetical protein